MPVWDDVITEADRAAYAKAGHGGRVGFGLAPALIVVDMNRAFVEPEYPLAPDKAGDVARRIARLVELCRERGRPVIYSTGTVMTSRAVHGRWKARANIDCELMREPRAFEIAPPLAPARGEPVITKSYPSAFAGSTLASMLIYYRVETVIIAGAVTSGCVRATCLDAFSYNFRTVVPEECVCDRVPISHEVALFEIHMKYGDVVPMAEVEEYLVGIEDSRAIAGGFGDAL